MQVDLCVRLFCGECGEVANITIEVLLGDNRLNNVVVGDLADIASVLVHHMLEARGSPLTVEGGMAIGQDQDQKTLGL